MSRRKPRAGIKTGSSVWYNGLPYQVISTRRTGVTELYPIWSGHAVVVPTGMVRLEYLDEVPEGMGV